MEFEISEVANITNLKPHTLRYYESIGLTVDEVKEIMLLMTVQSGFPSAIKGTNVLKELIKERSN